MNFMRISTPALLRTIVLSWIALASFGASRSFAQGEADAQLFVRANGDDVQAAIQIQIHDGWHLYHDELGPPDAVGKPTTVTFDGAEVTWSKVRFPAPKKLPQLGVGEGGRDTWIWGHVGTIVLFARGKAASGAKLDGLRATISGLTCEDAGSCVPYKQELESSGKGADAIFAAFPKDLVAAQDSAAPSDAKSDAPAKKSFAPVSPFGAQGKGLPSFGGFPPGLHAMSKLFVREKDGDFLAAVEVRVEPNYHIYHDEKGQPDSVGQVTTLKFEGADLNWSRPRFPTPTKLAQPGIGEGGRDTWIWGHEGTFVIYARAKKPAAIGAIDAAKIAVDIKGLTCTDAGECVPYEQELENSGAGSDELFAKFPSDLAAPSGATSTPTASVTTAPIDSRSAAEWNAVKFRDYEPRSLNVNGSTTDGEHEAPRSLFIWLFFAFIAGMLLNVMPCVLPVVSIKVLSFVQQAGESRSRILSLGLAFSAGILVVFFGLAIFAITAQEGWGAQFKNETFKIVMIAVVFAFALSLFDVFELGVPSKVGELAAVKREGLGDAFFKGIMATLLATPCSGPFLGSTLAWALAQTPLVIFAVFASVGFGMAAPYALLTSNPALLKYVPKPGAWMKTFKHLMGFLLMATVIFLMISVEKELLLFAVALLVFVGLGCWWWGNFATFDKSSGQKLAHLAIALGIVALGARISFVDLRGWLAPDEFWTAFDPAVLEKAHDSKRNVFVDFTADWCLTCKTNEKVVYTSDEIRELLKTKGALVMKADETGDSPRTQAIQRLREKLGARSIPFMAIFPGDDWKHPRTLKDLVTRGDVRAILDSCPNP